MMMLTPVCVSRPSFLPQKEAEEKARKEAEEKARKEKEAAELKAT